MLEIIAGLGALAVCYVIGRFAMVITLREDILAAHPFFASWPLRLALYIVVFASALRFVAALGGFDVAIAEAIVWPALGAALGYIYAYHAKSLFTRGSTHTQ